MFIIKNKNFIKINMLVNKSNVLLKENGFFNFLSDSNYAFTLMSNLSSWLKLSFKNKKDMLIKAQNMVIMECMSENVLSVLQNNSDLIMWGLKTIGLLGLGVGTSYAFYKRRSVSKEKNDNNDDPPNISSENSKFVDNRENKNSVDEAANNNDGCSKDEFSNIESLDPWNIFESVEYKLDNCGWWSANKEFPPQEYNNLILDLCKETQALGTKDISQFLQYFNIDRAVEYFSNVSGPYTENVKNLIDIEGAVEYFSLLRLSQFVGEAPPVDYNMLTKLFSAAFVLTLVKMIKDEDPSKKLSLVKINLLSKFSIQDYFRLFKESFLSIIFCSVGNDPSCYCPKYNGVRIIEKVIFNKSNMNFFFANGKFSQFMNKKSDFCTRRASRAYWLSVNHSIFDVYNDRTVERGATRDNHWRHVEESNYGKFHAVENDLKLNREFPVAGYLGAKSPYIIILWRYVIVLKNHIILESVALYGAKDTNR
jgi:hypothetical protein